MVTKPQLLQEFHRILATRMSAQAEEVSQERQAEITLIADRHSKLSSSQTYASTYTDTLLTFSGARCKLPQRVSILSMQEERARAKLSWESFDAKLEMCAFGSEELLSKFVADSESFVLHRSMTSVLFADQIPVWIRLGSERAVYTEAECARDDRKSSFRATDSATGETTVQETPLNHFRQVADPQGDRFRITYEARQVLRGYFHEDFNSKPACSVYKGLVVVPGVHARLSNISAVGQWIASESFWYKGHLVERVAGVSVGNIMSKWRQLRTEHPELTDAFTIMQQPSAYVDPVIFTWAEEELAQEIC